MAANPRRASYYSFTKQYYEKIYSTFRGASKEITRELEKLPQPATKSQIKLLKVEHKTTLFDKITNLMCVERRPLLARFTSLTDSFDWKIHLINASIEKFATQSILEKDYQRELNVTDTKKIIYSINLQFKQLYF